MLTGFASPPLICSERFPGNRRKLEGEGSSWGLGDEAVASWAVFSNQAGEGREIHPLSLYMETAHLCPGMGSLWP
jgi:hypothetical protein